MLIKTIPKSNIQDLKLYTGTTKRAKVGYSGALLKPSRLQPKGRYAL